MRRRLAAPILAAVLAGPALAQGLPPAPPLRPGSRPSASRASTSRSARPWRTERSRAPSSSSRAAAAPSTSRRSAGRTWKRRSRCGRTRSSGSRRCRRRSRPSPRSCSSRRAGSRSTRRCRGTSPSFAKTTVFVPAAEGRARRARRRRIVPGEASDHDPRPHDAHVRDLLRHGGSRSEVQGRQRVLVVPRGQGRDDRVVRRPPRDAAVRGAAGRAVRLRVLDGRPRTRRGGRLREEPRRVLRGADLPAAADAGHVLLPAARKARAPRDGLRTVRGREDRARPGGRMGGTGRLRRRPADAVSPAAEVSSRRPQTTGACSRCS